MKYHEDSKCGSCGGPLECERDAICCTCAPVTRPRTTEIVYRWPDGREEVRYRRPFGSDMAAELIAEVDALRARNAEGSPYSVRHV
jgi:hypothetical protein